MLKTKPLFENFLKSIDVTKKVVSEDTINNNIKNLKLSKKIVKENVEDDKVYQDLYDKLVPGSGKADTLEGEMLRAISKIIYRYYNDGDYFWKGYGVETAGPAALFLIKNAPKDIAGAILSAEGEDDGEKEYNNGPYELALKKALELIKGYILFKKGEYIKNDIDMYSYAKDSEEKWDSEEEKEDSDESNKSKKICEGMTTNIKSAVSEIKNLVLTNDIQDKEIAKVLDDLYIKAYDEGYKAGSDDLT